MSTTPPVAEAVAARLNAFVARMAAESAEYGPDAVAFQAAAASALEGGKRLRARFCHGGWRAVAYHSDASAAESQALWDVCAALEVFQSAALVHDDIIDNSDTRRGQPAAHRRFEHEHGRAGWSGDGDSFGRSAAVLLGDLLVAWSDDLLESALFTHPHAGSVRNEYARMRRDVTIGQYLDIAEESAWNVNDDSEHADRALRVASLKSARYSVEQPLLIGASLAGADEKQQTALRSFGHPVGLAFQLRDDVLGVFGDQAITGKPAGDDLREGKRTLLIAWMRETLTPSGRQEVDALIGADSLSAEQVSTLQSMIIDSGARARVEQLIARYSNDATSALRNAPLDSGAVDSLLELAHAAIARAS